MMHSLAQPPTLKNDLHERIRLNSAKGTFVSVEGGPLARLTTVGLTSGDDRHPEGRYKRTIVRRPMPAHIGSVRFEERRDGRCDELC
jgi:hypothetical protein